MTLRGVLRIVLIAAAVAVASGCQVPGQESQLSDGPGRTVYGPIFDAPDAYRAALLVDPWIDRIPVGGTSTFGPEIVKQVRIDIDGTGALPQREVQLQTPPTVALFSGDGGNRMRTFLHGSLDLLDTREGFIRGLSLTTSRAGYEAAALSGIVQEIVVDGELSAEDRRFFQRLLSTYAAELARHTLAWYDPMTTWVTVGPEVSNVLKAHVQRPGSVTPARGIYAAFVLRHEYEHSVTPGDDEDYQRLQWLEEGAADTLARWPGIAAQSAREFGLPYPKRFATRSYEPKDGYPEWVATVRLLLQAAAIDTTNPKAFAQASDVLQGQEVSKVPARIAARIAEKHGLSPRLEHALQLRIEGLRGDARRTRKVVGTYL